MTKIPTITRSWGLLFALGILFIVLGSLALGMVVGVTLISILFLGILFEIAGVAQLIDVFRSRQWPGAAWHAIIALFYLVMGGFVIFDPILASSIITLLIAWTFIIIGISRFAMAVSLRTHTAGWFFLLVSGIASVILGILIFAHWPSNSVWVIGLFIAIELLICGWSYVFFAIAMKQKSA